MSTHNGTTPDESTEQTDADRIAELEKQNQILQSRVDSLSEGLETIAQAIAGTDYASRVPEVVADHVDEPTLVHAVGEAGLTAENAIALARETGRNTTTPGSKKDLARRLTRKALVTREISNIGGYGPSTRGAVTTTEVADMAEAFDEDLESRTILDAWDDLTDGDDGWSCLEEDRASGEGPNPPKRLKLTEEPPKPMVLATAKDDLTSDDRREALITWTRERGGR